MTSRTQVLASRQAALEAIDSVSLLVDLNSQEPILNLKYLLSTDASQSNRSRASAEFVRSLISSLAGLPLVPDLSLWQNYLANLVLTATGAVLRELWPARTSRCRGVVDDLISRDISALASLLSMDPSLVAGDVCCLAFAPARCSSLAGSYPQNPVTARRLSLLERLARAVTRSTQLEDIEESLSTVLEESARSVGPGPFGISHVLTWSPPEDVITDSLAAGECAKYLIPVLDFDPVSFDDLVGYELQKQTIVQNTLQLSAGAPANNILLYGDRGTGKSSMIKAAALMFAREGVRLIDMGRGHLRDIPVLNHAVKALSLKFILFVDDLSFDEGETEYKHVKALLEGSVRPQPKNVVIYATSNRRHLVTERFGDVPDDIHSRDTVEEKLSLADRFGITLTFTAPSQREYLEIVHALAAKSQIDLDPRVLDKMALRWSMRQHGLSGRTARQFVTDLVGRKLTRGQACDDRAVP